MMKRICFAMVAAGLMIYLTGGVQIERRPDCNQGACCSKCAQQPCCDDDNAADEDGGRAARGGGRWQDQGGPAGAVAYPYYTTRGPRNYFDHNPQGIGP